MSGASRPSCWVCGSTNLNVERDHDGSNLLEQTEECRDCGLYRYEYAYGNSSEWFGWVRLDRYWKKDDDPVGWKSERSRRGSACQEVRAMWNDPSCRPFLLACRENPADAAPALVFADWLDERGLCPGQAAAIREAFPATAAGEGG